MLPLSYPKEGKNRSPGFKIAIAGKGGTGKTTISSLIVRYLLEKGLTPVLAVDADANTNLNEMLGLKVSRTIGDARDTMKKRVPIGMPKKGFMEYKIRESIVESEGFDLIAMGRPDGPGCYCYANTLMGECLDILLKNYRYVVIDNEAGMEHISRMVNPSVNLLLIVSDPAQRGIMTAGRIRDLALALQIPVDQTCLVVNRVPNGLDPRLEEEVARRHLELAGTVPSDERIYQFDLEGRPTTELSEESIALQSVFQIMDRLIPICKGVE